MNAYHNEWVHDFDNIFYEAREYMKKSARGKLANHDLPIEEKVKAAELIIKSHFLRSADVFMEAHDFRRKHPSYREYAAMMLNQKNYRSMFAQDVADALIKKYGTREGIPSGSYYPLNKQ